MMSCAGLVVAQILASVFLVPQEFEYRTAVVDIKQPLVLGMSTETSEAWISFVLNEEVGFSIEQAGSNLRVSKNPLPLLEKAKQIPELEQEAKRAIAERRIESRISDLWPQVTDTSVCITSASEDTEDMAPESKAVFVVARNFPRQDRGKLVEVVDDLAGPIVANRIRILGSVGPNDKPNTTIARGRSVSLAQR